MALWRRWTDLQPMQEEEGVLSCCARFGSGREQIFWAHQERHGDAGVSGARRGLGRLLNAVADKIEEMDVAAIIYASYNDQTTETVIPRDRVLSFIQEERHPTNEEVRDFLRMQGKHREHHIANVTIAEQSFHTPEGVMIRIEHEPLEKFRILFPLSEPLRITDLAPTQRKAHERWKRLLLGYADHVGVIPDRSCVDVSRAYYMPSHRPGSSRALS